MNIINIAISALAVFFSQLAFCSNFKTEKWNTPNGVQVIFYQAMEVPMLDISLAFAAGSAYDGKQHGLSALTTRMMNQGNARREATAIAEILEETGSRFSVDTNRDMVVFDLRTLTEQKPFEQATKTFAQIINHPDFPKTAVDREKKQLLMTIQQTDDSPEEVAFLNFFKNLYQGHPYAHPIEGTRESVRSLTRQQVINFYKQYFVGSNATLVLVGAIDTQKAHQLAEQLTKELPKGIPAHAIPKALPRSNGEKINIAFPSSQTIVRLGQVGIDHHNPNYFSLMVGNYILGGGSLVSRLGVEVREKRGLTYGVDSQFLPMPGEGPFVIGLSTKNNQAAQALTITHDTLNAFIQDGPKEQELESAKHYLTGSFPLSLASNRSIANLLLRMSFYHLPDNYLETYVARINSVTNDEIKLAFKQHVNPDKMLLVTVGQS
jgi:zinc protease